MVAWQQQKDPILSVWGSMGDPDKSNYYCQEKKQKIDFDQTFANLKKMFYFNGSFFNAVFGFSKKLSGNSSLFLFMSLTVYYAKYPTDTMPLFNFVLPQSKINSQVMKA